MNATQLKLIQKYLSGQALNNELVAEVKRDPVFCEEAAEYIKMDRMLRYTYHAKSTSDFLSGVQQRLEGDTQARHLENNRSKVSSVIRPHKWMKRFPRAMAACICIVMVGLFFVLDTGSRSIGAVSNLAASKANGKTIEINQLIFRGDFHLSDGYVEITLNNGVTLVLEAPSSLSFLSDEHVELQEGNIVARVPENAIGFRVDTPSSHIVDLGTEFGVSVNKEGKSQVHVLDGEVKVKTPESDTYEHLVKSEARAYDLQKQIETIESQPQRFMRNLPGKSLDTADYLHWSLDEEASDRLSCRGPGINTLCYPAQRKSLKNGELGPEFSQGRFGGAVYFNGESTWLETAFPGIGGSKPRTVAFWVKVPEDVTPEEGFGILSWGLLDARAAWQISINPLPIDGPLGRIRIGTKEGVVVGLTDLRDNQWHHLAIVLYGGTEANLSTHVLMYVDGNLEKSYFKSIAKVDTKLNHPQSRPLIMGRNIAFTDNEPDKTKRFFRGYLDEVYIFDTALKHEDIIELNKNNTFRASKK